MDFDPDAVREFERAGWNRAAAAYEASFASATRQFIDPLLEAAAIETDARALDLCCGPGFVAAAGKARGGLVIGYDFSPAMLEQARVRFPGITFDFGDAEALPYRDADFDAVVSNFGIHHVPRPALALAGVHRILRPGKKFAFSVWAGHDENIAWRLVFDAIRQHGDPRASAAPPPGGGFATATDCLAALQAAGFAGTDAVLVRGLWRHRDAASMLAALHAGTARMAAMIDAQTDTAMPAILAALETAAAPFHSIGPDGGELSVPIACYIASGIKP
jgi:SAM-dependent methyltransferase